MEITNVLKDRATLSWKPPKDDGGSRVTGYVVERRDTAKGPDAWIPVTQACKETSFTVPSLLDGHEYDFRVMAINENGISEPLKSSAPVTAKLPFSECREPAERPMNPLSSVCEHRASWCTRTTRNQRDHQQYRDTELGQTSLGRR